MTSFLYADHFIGLFDVHNVKLSQNNSDVVKVVSISNGVGQTPWGVDNDKEVGVNLISKDPGLGISYNFSILE